MATLFSFNILHNAMDKVTMETSTLVSIETGLFQLIKPLKGTVIEGSVHTLMNIVNLDI